MALKRLLACVVFAGLLGQSGWAQTAATAPFNPKLVVPKLPQLATQAERDAYIAERRQQVESQIKAIRAKVASHSRPAVSPSPTMRIIAGQIPHPGGLPPLQTQLGSPGGAVADASGNLYISDSNFSLILKVTQAGVVSIFAGTGSTGYSGDGGPATSATFGYIINMAMDNAGNLYFSDITYSVIRKINLSTGIISLYAGTPGVSGYGGDNGPANQALLGLPYGIASDSSNNLYIADFDGYVREVNGSTGVISTLAGGSGFGNGCTGAVDDLGDGCLATQAIVFPYSVAVFGSTVYIGDAFNEIRAVNLSTGIITAFAGTAFEAPGGPGQNGDGGPASAAYVGTPYAMVTDTLGDLYFVDNNGAAVREINTSLIINTVVGGDIGSFGGDGGLATSAYINGTFQLWLLNNSTMLIGDTGNNRIREVTNLGPTGTINTIMGNGYSNYYGDGGPATSAGLSNPSDISEDAAGNIYIADSGNYAIRRIDAVTGDITTFAGTGLNNSPFTVNGVPANSVSIDAFSFAMDSGGNLYIPDNDTFAEISQATGDISQLPQAFTGVNSGTLAVDGSGNLYFTDGSQVDSYAVSTGDITVIANAGNSSGFSGDGEAAVNAELNYPTGVALDGLGNLYVADADNYRVRVINLASGIINTVAGNGTEGDTGDNGPAIDAELNYGYDITTDSSGNVLFTDVLDGVVRKITISSGTIDTIAGTGTRGYNGPGLAPLATEFGAIDGYQDSFGNLFVVDEGSELVWLDAATPLVLKPVLTPSATRVTLGQGATLSLTFLGPRFGVAPTGSVAFQVDGTTFATANLVKGAANLTQSTTGLAAGTYSVVAKYSGDSNFAAETSAAVPIVLTTARAVTTTTLAVTPNPVGTGGKVTLAVTVQGSNGSATPTGTVTFSFGSYALGSATLKNGAASLSESTAGLSLGTYGITATYSGDASSEPSTSNEVMAVIGPVATTTALTINPTTVSAGGTVMLSAKVTPASGSTPTGTVTFTTGNVTLGTIALTGGVASVTAPTSGYPAGTYPIIATYNGSSTCAGSASAAESVTLQ